MGPTSPSSTRAQDSDRGVDPPYYFEDYVGTRLRSPREPLIVIPQTLSEQTGPVFGDRRLGELDHDLTRQHAGEPLGERIIVSGRVLGSDGKPLREQLVEIWQANAAGRYAHTVDNHDAPLDPNFSGGGRCLTGDDGEYGFVTIKPGAYPWRNHQNAWRPAHIHFSLFGTEFSQRLVTQMYFPGDPLFALDPIYQAVTDRAARDRLVATYDHDDTQPEWSLGYRWDIVLTGTHATPMEGDEHA